VGRPGSRRCHVSAYQLGQGASNHEALAEVPPSAFPHMRMGERDLVRVWWCHRLKWVLDEPIETPRGRFRVTVSYKSLSKGKPYATVGSGAPVSIAVQGSQLGHRSCASTAKGPT
jgi:hypothetical protein